MTNQKKRIVIALGGNALGKTSQSQKEAVKKVASLIIDLHNQNYQIVICHGNGPQVGIINQAFKEAHQTDEQIEMMPFAESGAMSQGYIGYHLQNAVQNESRSRRSQAEAVTIVTQTLVDKNDVAFQNPTKPIGTFMTQAVAQKFAKANNWNVKEDAGRGWRRVVPSPFPQKIIEKHTIDTLLNQDVIVIAGGGGGIPVYQEQEKLIGIDAVIDKDNTSAKLAIEIHADFLIILTAVKKVMLNYNLPNQKELSNVDCHTLEKYINDKQFAAGSMLPKIQAAITFCNSTNQVAYIGHLDDASKILSQANTGTKIFK